MPQRSWPPHMIWACGSAVDLTRAESLGGLRGSPNLLIAKAETAFKHLYSHLAATQLFSLLRKAAQNNCSAIWSISASGMTMAGALPSSSRVTRVDAAEASTQF